MDIRLLLSLLMLAPAQSSPEACELETTELDDAEEHESNALRVSFLQTKIEHPKVQSLSPVQSPVQTFRSQDVALLRADAGPLQHYGQDCYSECKGAGWCQNYCGDGNACCQFGKDTDADPRECRMIEFYPIVHAYTCVLPSGVTAPQTASCLSPRHGTETMVLYHQTSPEIGAMILKNGFRAGFRGWCGGAIYFARTPEATNSKTSALDSHKGFVIEAVVQVGKVRTMSSSCDTFLTGEKLHNEGYDSITFNPSDGDELVVYCSGQILSAKHHHSH